MSEAIRIDEDWHIRLFNRSVLKQQKFRMLTTFLGPTKGLTCLDVGADNGVISYLLRRRGGCWKSADLDALSVQAIKNLVKTDAYQINGESTPFGDDEFDRVVIVDFLEHIPNDKAFVRELFRILKPGGLLVVNVPHAKRTLLRRFRLAIGQTDEKHGHLRPGYTLGSLQRVLDEAFTVDDWRNYSKFFSEFIDTLIVQAVYRAQGDGGEISQKGALVTGEDLLRHRTAFRLYSLVYPVLWLISKLDALLFFSSGYMLIARASVSKQATSSKSGSLSGAD